MNTKGIYLILTAAIISGFSIFLNSRAVIGIDSSIFTLAKIVLVAMALLCIILGTMAFRDITRLSATEWGMLSLVGLIGGSVPFLLFFKGLQMTTGSTAGLIQKTLFIFVIVFAIFFLKEKITKSFAAGAALLLLSTFLITPFNGLQTGHVLVLTAAILWAGEYVLSKHMITHVPALVVAFGRMAFGSLFILLYIIIAGKGNMLLPSVGSHVGWILITSLFLLAYVITFYTGLAGVPVSTAACILTISAPISTLLSLFTGGTISILQTLGIATGILGAITILWTTRASYPSRA